VSPACATTLKAVDRVPPSIKTGHVGREAKQKNGQLACQSVFSGWIRLEYNWHNIKLFRIKKPAKEYLKVHVTDGVLSLPHSHGGPQCLVGFVVDWRRGCDQALFSFQFVNFHWFGFVVGWRRGRGQGTFSFQLVTFH
jgi:hypothetical protein